MARNWPSVFFLFIFGLISSVICQANAENPPSFHSQNTALIVRKSLDDLNKTTFSNRSFHLDLLKNCPEVIPLLADWIYEDWHLYDTSLTKENLIKGFSQRLNDDKLPLTFVLLKDSIPIGAITLKEKTIPELADLDDGSCWGGSFHVETEFRRDGVGEELAKSLILIAKQLGYHKIRFYTSNPQNVAWYTERGAEVIETRPFRGHIITIMQYSF
jgi:GNAT superfamily N-acetyltransferase